MFAAAGLALIAGEYAYEKAKVVAKPLGEAMVGAVDAVEEGVYTFTDNAKAVVRDFAKDDGKRAGLFEAIRERQAERWRGLTGRQEPKFTPEEMSERKKRLDAAKAEIHQAIAILDEEQEDLRGSIFHALYANKIAIKGIKKNELEIICKSKSLEELHNKAAVALGKPNVVVGRKSRTKALLQKITDTLLDVADKDDVKIHPSIPVKT